MKVTIDWQKFEEVVLESFPSEYAVIDYWGNLVDHSQIRRSLVQARKRIEIVCDFVYKIVPPGSRVLDVGTQYGLALLVLKDAGYEVCGTDLEESISSYSNPLKAVDIPVFAWDLHRFCPLSESSFDVVIATEVLEHIQFELGSAVERLCRLLRPGGWLILTTPNIYQLPNIIKILRGENICEPFPDKPVFRNDVVIDSRTHPREPTMKELCQAVESNGLEICKKTYFNCGKRHIFKEIILSMVPRVLRSNLLVVAQKPS